MLSLMLAVAAGALTPQDASRNALSSLKELDAACANNGTKDQVLALQLDSGGFTIVSEQDSAAPGPIRRPLRALRGKVRVHVAENERPLTWSGSVGQRAALAAVSRGEASATLVGRLASEEGLPACFGHRQSNSRSVALTLEALVVSDADGSSIGHFAPAPEVLPPTPGGRAQVTASCGNPCAYDAGTIEEAVARIRTRVIACTKGSSAGIYALELELGGSARAPKIKGEVASLPEKVQACTRDAIEGLRLPGRARPGALLLQLEVAARDTSGKEI